LLVISPCWYSDISNTEVSYDEDQSLADSLRMRYFEVSGKDGSNVHDTFASFTATTVIFANMEVEIRNAKVRTSNLTKSTLRQRKQLLILIMILQILKIL